MRARASALRTRFLRGRLPNVEAEKRELLVDSRRARTFSSRLISSSTAVTSSSRVIFSLVCFGTVIAGNECNTAYHNKFKELLQRL